MASSRTDSKQPDASGSELVGGTETSLMVDDEAAKWLRVLMAAEPAMALALLAATELRVDLLVAASARRALAPGAGR